MSCLKVGDKRKGGHTTESTTDLRDPDMSNGIASVDTWCDIDFDTRSYSSGLLTRRMRPNDIPRMKLTRYNRIRLECTDTRSDIYPDFTDIPVWLKPFLYYHHQMGCRAGRLRSLFRTLPDDLLSVIRTACTTVVVLALNRMRIAHDSANLNPMFSESGCDKRDEEPWLYEGLGLSDDELDTFDNADFGVVRYFWPLSFL